MAGLFGATATTTASNTSGGSIANDVLVSNGPEDTPSHVVWSSQANHLAVASWDGKVRVYDHTQSPTGNGVAIIPFDKPALTCDWSKDGRKVVGGALDKTVKMIDLGAGATTAQQVAIHDDGVKSVRFFEMPNSNGPMLATGSWDKTIRYWDLRQQTPIASLTCSERVYSLDIREKLMVIATADRKIQLVNLDVPTNFYKTIESPLKWQSRVVTCYLDGSGWATASVEGRCAMNYVEEKDSSLNFTFRCHRETKPGSNISDVYSVNAVNFHPKFPITFSTAGSDGSFCFWDRDAHARLRTFPSVGGPITSTSFNGDGSLFAYAVGYDWSKGYSFNNPQQPCKVMIHAVTEEEVRPKPSARKR